MKTILRSSFTLVFLCGFLALPVLAGAASKHSAGSAYPSYEGLVMCGYQGWFRAEGDGSGRGLGPLLQAGQLRPGLPQGGFVAGCLGIRKDLSHPFPTATERPRACSVPGTRARWICISAGCSDYGIDGVFMQRFFDVTRTERSRRDGRVILGHALQASQKYGRALAVMYDLSGLHAKGEDCASVIQDWKELVDELKLTSQGTNQTYLYHRGKPLVAIWGLGFPDRSYNIRNIGLDKLIDFLKHDPEYGGCSRHARGADLFQGLEDRLPARPLPARDHG